MRRKIAESSRNSDRKVFIRCYITGSSEKLGFVIQSKTDRKVAVSCLWNGVDVLAVLPTGFGKSLILKALRFVASNDHATAMGLYPSE